MTDQKITLALRRISACKRNKYSTEALLDAYHLNMEVIKFMFLKTSPTYEWEGKKLKAIVKDFQKEASINPTLKSIITKQSIKSLKLWLSKMETYFKTIKLHRASNTALLLNEAEKICAILLISRKKLTIK